MQIAIVGGTGTLGRYVAERLSQCGHEVRALSRHSSEYQVDLKTGEGLAEALRGCDVVVDASNDASKSASQTLVSGTERLLAAEQAAGVQHHVGVSIVGCELVPMGYFQTKAEQERVLTVISFTLNAGRIIALDVVRNPDKLRNVPVPPP